jgi:16S rRNA (cytosine1402-N4)-methyltransferase
MYEKHQAVLLAEVIEGLNIQKDGLYIDGTFGRGGHANAVLKKLDQSGRLLVLDKDEAAIRVAKTIKDERLLVYHASFAKMYDIAKKIGWLGKVDGVTLDLGVSSPQLDNADRGFSFLKDGPLDMRMNQTQSMDAAAWLNMASESEIANVLWRYGEEQYARRIAKEIVKERENETISRTQQLVKLVEHVIPFYKRRHHVATRTFQAIRIFINKELEELELCLSQLVDILAVGGRLCVITFHSLENKIVKRFIKKLSKIDIPSQIPLTVDQMPKPRLKLLATKTPSKSEIEANIRSRSARLSIVEKYS